MSNVLSDDKVKTIAKCFADTNYNNKGLALRNAGYSKNYSEHDGLKLFDNSRIKSEIARLQAKTSEKVDLSLETRARETKELLQAAKDKNCFGPSASLNDQLNRIGGCYNADLSGGLSIVDIMAVVGVKVDNT